MTSGSCLVVAQIGLGIDPQTSMIIYQDLQCICDQINFSEGQERIDVQEQKLICPHVLMFKNSRSCTQHY